METFIYLLHASHQWSENFVIQANFRCRHAELHRLFRFRSIKLGIYLKIWITRNFLKKKSISFLWNFEDKLHNNKGLTNIHHVRKLHVVYIILCTIIEALTSTSDNNYFYPSSFIPIGSAQVADSNTFKVLTVSIPGFVKKCLIVYLFCNWFWDARPNLTRRKTGDNFCFMANYIIISNVCNIALIGCITLRFKNLD